MNSPITWYISSEIEESRISEQYWRYTLKIYLEYTLKYIFRYIYISDLFSW